MGFRVGFFYVDLGVGLWWFHPRGIRLGFLVRLRVEV